MTTLKTKIAVVQMCSTSELKHNLEKAESLVREAASDGAKLVMLPENFALLAPGDAKLNVAESISEGGPILEKMKHVAKSLGVELVLGGFFEKSPEPKKVFNSCVHVLASGEVSKVYRKLHLFDVALADGTVLKESDGVTPGHEVVVSDAVCGTMGLSVCYDLRFPELYRKHVDAGATVLAVPSAFTLSTGKDHWHVLLRARAIENQSYVLAAAQWGHHFGTRRSYGHAMIVDPWGIVLAECGEGEGFASAWIDQRVVQDVRQQLPSLKHRVL